MVLKSISDIIGFIDTYNVTDLQTINDICKSSLDATFLPFKVSDDIRTKEHYIYWLTIYQDRQKRGLELPTWIDTEYPFDIRQIYKVKK